MERLIHTHSDDTSELLSAYSDDAVDVVERRRAEDFARSCPACAQELRELRLFKQVLHELPNVQPRRSFTIDPATAPRPRWLLFPTLRFASLVTSLLLLIVLGVDGLSSFGTSPTANSEIAARSYGVEQDSGGAAADAQTGAAAMAPESAAMPQAAQAPSVAIPSAAASTAAAEVTQSSAGNEASSAAAATGDTSGAAGGTSGAVPDPAPMPSMMVLNTDAASAAQSAAPSNPDEELAAEDTMSQALIAPTGAAAGGTDAERLLRANPPAGIDTEGFNGDVEQATSGPLSSFDTLLVVELVLGITALAFGIGAYIAWRRRL